MREKRARSHDKSEPFFDFELTDADFDEQVTIDISGVPATALEALAAKYRANEAVESGQKAQYVPGESEYSDPDPLPVAENDPLHPCLFVGHHRRMEREERRMQMLERQQLITTASRVRQQREQLLKPEWKAHIEKIVRIHNSADGHEVKRKRELALSEIQEFLKKFDEYNARYNRRESKAESAELRKLHAQQKRAKAAKQKNSKLRAKALDVEQAEREDTPVAVEFRPFAFGYMLPPRPFPPREYALPVSLVEEVAAYDVAAAVRKNMPWLSR